MILDFDLRYRWRFWVAFVVTCLISLYRRIARIFPQIKVKLGSVYNLTSIFPLRGSWGQPGAEGCSHLAKWVLAQPYLRTDIGHTGPVHNILYRIPCETAFSRFLSSWPDKCVHRRKVLLPTSCGACQGICDVSLKFGRRIECLSSPDWSWERSVENRFRGGCVSQTRRACFTCLFCLGGFYSCFYFCCSLYFLLVRLFMVLIILVKFAETSVKVTNCRTW